MKKINVAKGISWVEIPEADLFIQCGCPADSVKHLMKRGLIVTVEKDDIIYETGPNAILLSDKSVQNGDFSNLGEFPILQMLYRQGMIVPGHPKNTGDKPILIGIKEQVVEQADYIYRGNYGLATEEEMINAGASIEMAENMIRLKRKFAYDNIKKTEELIELKTIENDSVEIKNGVFLKRKALNIYEFTYKDESLIVDLNLKENERYEPAYTLGSHHIVPEYFSVIHIGEGDGWDVNRGCMSSLITYQGKIYLIDAGPNIEYTLTALGISINQIEGVFHTHAHDDHFAGLTTLIRSDKKLKYYATSLVRHTVIKKMCALMSIEEEMFNRFFEIHNLDFDVWNDIEGLEVKPIYSPHPVETSILFFRTLWKDGHKVYGHFADIISLKLLESFIEEDKNKSGVTREFYEKVKKDYLEIVDLKKIDNGGGMIHGCAEDFLKDKSGKMILSHSAEEFSDFHKEIGSNAIFGTEDILISKKQDYSMRGASEFLSSFYPTVPRHQILMLLNCQVSTYNAGSILIKKDENNKDVFLVLSGVMEFIDSKSNTKNVLSIGSVIGDYYKLMNMPSPGTFRAASYVDVLKIPGDLFIKFVYKNKLQNEIIDSYINGEFLKRTKLFDEMISYPTQTLIAKSMKNRTYCAGEEINFSEKPELLLLEYGEIKISRGENTFKLNTPGDFLGEESIIYNKVPDYKMYAVVNTLIRKIPGEILQNIPIVQWKLLETLELRKKFHFKNN